MIFSSVYMNVIDTVLYYSGSSLLEAWFLFQQTDLKWSENQTINSLVHLPDCIKMDGLIND